MCAFGSRAETAKRGALQPAGAHPLLFNSFSPGVNNFGGDETPTRIIASLDAPDMQCILLRRRMLKVCHTQAEHERVQGRLFDLHESRDIASNTAAAASELTLQQKEALAQQLR